MAQLAQDTVIRADSSNISPGSDGQTYDSSGLSGAALSVSSNEIFINAGGFGSVFYGSKTTANIDFSVRIEYDGLGFAMGPAWRAVDHNNYYYLGDFFGGLAVYKWVSGGFTNIQSASYSMTASSYYWVRIHHIGTHIQARIWADGASEPGTWNIDFTDSTYTAAGQFGMQWNSGQGRFDHLLVTDGSTTNTRTVPATAALLQTDTRTIPSSAALLQTDTRAIPSSAALLQTDTRTIPSTAALLATDTRTIPSTAALLQTDTRTIPTSAALLQTDTRVIPSSAALLQTSKRTIPCKAALSGNVIAPTTNATFYVRGGNATFYVR